MYEERIQHLNHAHKHLDKVIDGKEKSGIYNDTEITNLKKQRLVLKQQIEQLKEKGYAVK